ncbi:Neuropeptide-like 1 [Acromyrmex echinatior]|uniref:Neuropeptide-like 1 n=1 Tax=Acromyrmex echinatior TaxID=103372 RepID=F4X5K3_ACREC|nr:Neuropeptide-like 1 [Acromyrmex echinatior]
MAHLKALSSEENDDAEICIPSDIYLELLRDLTIRGHLVTRDLIPESEKRSLATLAKNDDLPFIVQEREDDGDDEEKRSINISSDNLDELVRALMGDEYRRRTSGIYDYQVKLDPELIEYPLDKRNVGALARDFALPTGRRHIGSVLRDYNTMSGKRNIGSLARQSMLPMSGKRNVASLARDSMLPQNGKRNVAALARDSSLPYGKRYLGSLVRNGGYPVRGYDEGKRNIASLARNADWPGFMKRGGTAGVGRMIARVLNRHGRSLNDHEAPSEPLDLQQLIKQDHNNGNDAKENVAGNWPTLFSISEELDDSRAKNRSNRRMDAATSQTRHKRQIDFSDEYPLPVVQNTNILDYEDMIEALADHYPNTEKRFLGSSPEMPADSGYTEVLQPIKWEDPADGTSSNYTPLASAKTRSLRPFIPKTRYLQSLHRLHGDCRHGFKRFLLPDIDNFLRTSNSRIVSNSM